MTSESIEAWKERFEADTTSHQRAERIIANLIGYRSASIYRLTDTENLAAAIEAIRFLDKPSR